MKIKILSAILATISLSLSSQAVTQYWNTNGTGATWTASNWGTSSAGPFTTAYTPNNDVDFSANSTVTFATVSIGNVTVDPSVTVTITAGGTLSMGGAVRTFDIGSGSTLAWSTQTVTSNSAAGITKNGAGILNLNALTFSTNMNGGFTLNNGTVIVSGLKALGNGSLTINGGTLQSSGGSAFVVSSITIGGDFIFAGTGNDSYAANVALGSSVRTITNSTTSSATRTFGGIISGTGGLSFAGTGGSGGIVLSGANDYSGGTTVGGGLVKLSGSGSLGNTSGGLTVNSGTLDLNGTSQTVGNLTGTGGSVVNNLTATNVTLTIGNGNGTGGNYQGVIANNTTGTGTVALSKTGAGSITLSGANTFTGGTSISGGTLVLGSATTLQSATGTLTVSGGTLSSNVASTTIGGNLSLSGGTIDPDGTTIGTIILSAGKTFTMSSGTLSLKLGTSYDQITGGSGSTFNITGGTLALDVSGAGFSYASSYQILTSFTGTSNPVSGLTITGLTGYTGTLDGSGLLSFTAVAVPEPATYAAILGGLGLALCSIRRRR